VLLAAHLVGCSRSVDVSDYFDGTNNARIIASPASVTAWRTAAWYKGDEKFSSQDLYQKAGTPVPVPSDLASRLSNLLLDKRTYWIHPNSAKGSIALPAIVMTFSNSTRGVDVFFSFADNSLQVKMVQPSSTGQAQLTGGDFDPSRAELVRIVKRIFPTDERIQALSETRANGALWPDPVPTQ
jgi:hypothetical protein